MSGDFHVSLQPWLLLALAFPLASFVICFVIKPHISWLTPIIASLLLVASLIFCLILFITTQAASNHLASYQWTWFELGASTIYFSLMLDHYSLIMLLMVVSVATLVHIYSAGYMVHDASQGRFFCFLGLFTFAMMGLVVSGNLLVMFCFWELVGLASYLLVGHWRSRPSAARAATRALLYNRVGDAGFIAGLLIVWQSTGSFELSVISGSNVTWTTWAGLCIFFGAVAKSAQLPLMTWLPDAMEGPTPVSALIHAATMVAAGVFIMVRLQYLFSPSTLTVVAAVGSITALYSGWLATRQSDLKKILAYSTISQLGIMMIAIGLGAFDGAFLHLITHGFFKACMFLCAGAVIYTLESSQKFNELDPQDIRNMGGLRRNFPILFPCFCIAVAAMSGVPLFSGFISKEAMIVGMMPNITHWSGWIFVVAFFGASLLTVMYSYRMVKAVFLGPGTKPKLQPVASVMMVPSLICAGLCLWFFYSPNPLAFFAWFQPFPHLFKESSTLIPVASATWVLISIIIAVVVYRGPVRAIEYSESPIDVFYNTGLVSPLLGLGSFASWTDNRIVDRLIHRFVYAQVALAKIGGQADRYVIDGSVTLVARIIKGVGNLSRAAVGGKVQSYLLWALAGFVALIFWFIS